MTVESKSVTKLLAPTVHPRTLILRRHIHPAPISVGKYNHTSIHSIPVDESVCTQSQFDAEYLSEKISRALRANSLISYGA